MSEDELQDLDKEELQKKIEEAEQKLTEQMTGASA